VEITSTKDGIFIRPTAGRTIRRKPRDENEANGFYNLMKSKIESNINAGKTRWAGNRETRNLLLREARSLISILKELDK
jgi:hypothetical protein